MPKPSYLQLISAAEQQLLHLSAAANKYTLAVAKVCDEGDKLAVQLQRFGEADSHAPAQAQHLARVAHCLASVQDYSHLLSDRLHRHVVLCLHDVSASCSVARAAVRAAAAHREGRGRARAQSCSRSAAQLRRSLEDWQQRRLTLTARAVRDLLQSELAYHARALECYTDACTHLRPQQVSEDMQSFRSCLSGCAECPPTARGLDQRGDLSVISPVLPPKPRPCSWHGPSVKNLSSDEEDVDSDVTEDVRLSKLDVHQSDRSSNSRRSRHRHR